MATQVTIKFGDIALQIGNGADPEEAFDTVCGFTSIDHQYSVSTQNEDLPDCDDVDAVGFDSPAKTSVGESVSFQGFVDPSNSDKLREWVYADDDINIRLVYNKGAKVGYLAGPAVFTGGNESWERRQSGKLAGAFAFTAKPTWTPT